MFKSFVDDIILKTTPMANIALPMESYPNDLLRSLVMENYLVERPREYFVPFVSEASLRNLKQQLQITLRDVMNALVDEDYETTTYRMKQLSKLGEVLPEAVECSQLGLEAGVRHASLLRERVVKVIEQLREAKVHKKFTQLLELLKKDMTTVLKSEPLRLVCSELCNSHSLKKLNAVQQLCMPQSCTSGAFCIDQIQTLTDMVCQDVPEFDPSHPDMENLMSNRGSFLTAVVRLKEISETLEGYPGAERASEIYRKAFDRFYSFVDRVLSDAENNFQTSLNALNDFERQAWFLAVLIQGFLNKPDSGGGEHEKMEELEHRRLKLMLRLEMKISDNLELVTSARFPECAEDESLSGSVLALKRSNLGDLKGPQKFLSSVGEVPRLCKFLPSKIDPEEAKRTAERFEKSLDSLFEGFVTKAQQVCEEIHENKPHDQGDDGIAAAPRDAVKLKTDAQILRDDISKIKEEMASFRTWWSEDSKEKMEKEYKRLEDLELKVTGMITTYEKQIADEIADTARLQQQAICGFFPSCFCT